MNKVLQVTASARTDGSVSRDLSAQLASSLSGTSGEITVRDIAVDPISFVDADWVGANFTDPANRTDQQVETLEDSEALVREIENADHIVIGAPIYNFGIPASLKAWVDKIARAKRTFHCTSSGPEGLIKGKTAWLVIASGGTALDSDIDFATPYLRFVRGFIGIDDVRVIDATRWAGKSDAEKQAVLDHINASGADAA